MRHLLLLPFMFIMAGCNPCSDVICKNGDKIEDGQDCVCECDQWYEGDECKKPVNEKLTGNYAGSIDCDGNSRDAVFIVEKRTDVPNGLRFKELKADFRLTNRIGDFKIPKQDLPDSESIVSVSGSGFIAGDRLEVNLIFTNTNGEQSQCEFVGNR